MRKNREGLCFHFLSGIDGSGITQLGVEEIKAKKAALLVSRKSDRGRGDVLPKKKRKEEHEGDEKGRREKGEQF
jgi:hypothetical protein